MPTWASVRYLPGERNLVTVGSAYGFAKTPRGIDVVKLCRVDERIECGGDFGAALGFGPVVIFTADDRSSDSAFGRIVVERHFRVLEKASESIPVGDGVRSSFSDRERLENGLAPESRLSFAVTAADSVRRNSAFCSRSPLARLSFGGPLDVHSEWSTAHSFRLGGAWWPEPKRLLVSVDVAYTLLDDAVNSLPVTLDFLDPRFAGTHIEQQIALEWQDSIAALVGAEYMVTELLAARLGYHIARSGTPRRYASPLVPPPGVIQTIHAGGGVRTESWRADVGGAYAFAGGADVEEPISGPAGKYGGDYWLPSASLSYRH